MATKSILIREKPHYEILDGLRGVAALLVVLFHISECAFPEYGDYLFSHGYLAVDFFFALSGFVIGYAYDDRWAKGLTFGEFIKRRVIRLQPMVIIGMMIGAFWFYFGDIPGSNIINSVPWWKILLFLILGCLMFPMLPAIDTRGWGVMYPLNGSAWTLAWEYVANICYALFIRKFSKRILSFLIVVSAAATIIFAMRIQIFSLFKSSYSDYTVHGGFGMSIVHIGAAAIRLAYPFLCGLLIYRMSRWRIRIAERGFLWCSVVLAVVLCMPYVGGDIHPRLNGVYEAAAILIIFPMLVSAGAGSPLTGQKTMKVCKFLGMISYPLYITHSPMVYMLSVWREAHPGAPIGIRIYLYVIMFITSLAVAYACVKVYDTPVRAWLSKKFQYNK